MGESSPTPARRLAAGALALLAGLAGASLAANSGSDTFPNLPSITAEAQAGNPRAQFKLGDFHFAQADFTNAVIWYRKAAEQGEAEAQISLATCYAQGRGVTRDPREAAHWSRAASSQLSTRAEAESGKPRAQIKIAEAYLLRADFTNAVLWYRKAAELGDAEAQISLAASYAQGRGVTRDLQAAAHWSQLAAARFAEETPAETPAPAPLLAAPVSETVAASAGAVVAAPSAPPPAPEPPPRVQRIATLPPTPPQIQPVPADLKPAN